ncbi:MAG: hypothetical protein P4L85_24110 [Paludisphaera borealis]|uniref:hypothetical protein n=1 Tax=Paludisphaera borealis TaxID=1387353 RepID=UPI00284215D4|nr:hypothetical protein [Paludisphaera borealis]MDR3622457.1 hypothetical protein [Paludisphaera borealis]
MQASDAIKFEHHATAGTLRIESHQFNAGQKQLLIYGVRRSGHGTPGQAEAEVHVHLAQNGNGTVTGGNIRWVGEGHYDALDMKEGNAIIQYCLRYYFPDSNRRAMFK